MYHQEGGCNDVMEVVMEVVFHLEKIKKQNANPRKFQKKIKRVAVSFSKMCKSKIFVT